MYVLRRLLVNRGNLVRQEKISSRLLATRASSHKIEDSFSTLAITPESIIANYRLHGHLTAKIDPLDLKQSNFLPNTVPELVMGRDESGQIKVGRQVMTSLAQLQDTLSTIYCGSIGYEIGHVEEVEEREWLYQTIESMNNLQASPLLQKRMAKVLIESEAFDHFMAKKFGQVKRYGLEGAEAMIVAIDVLLQSTSSEHVVFGMAHRGRINLMVGLLGYLPEAVFYKLAGNNELPEAAGWNGSADVLSHLSSTEMIEVGGEGGRKIKVSMLPNPSHLEAINPVQQGVVYAFQKIQNVPSTLAVQVHGDAAFNGQGVIQETFQMSQLKGFSIDGTVHIITNNQIGYTATADLGRSSRYASSPAKATGAPIFHVNGDMPEDVAKVMAIALKYKEKFKKDVVIDLVCYRRHGHNELDEPNFTQPQMYQIIKNRPTLPESFTKSLIQANIMTVEDVNSIKEQAFEKLEIAMKSSKEYKPVKFGIQKDLKVVKQSSSSPPLSNNGVSKTILEEIVKQSVDLPTGFKVHDRLQKYHIESRLKTFKEQGIVDWATAEALAIGSLLKEGFNVRLSGQDVQRGTFSHRHFVFTDQETGLKYTPFNGFGNGQLQVHNSHLSEFGVVGFEYGISIADSTKTLPIWEAQFGDFFNGAQIIFDTFISSGQTKWGLQSPLTILLPHGYDGAGPEHSSCRLERFLQMSNAPFDPIKEFDPNWHIVHPTTPANYFHLLRRQLHRDDGKKKPLIMAAPKTLLRLPVATSSIDDLILGTNFKPLLEDSRALTMSKGIKKLVFCSGKFYYEIEKERNARKANDMAIIRIEELCPLPSKEIIETISKFQKLDRIIWCQEEHQNMGAFSFIQPRLSKLIPKSISSSSSLEYVGRDEASAPAAGYSKLYKHELASIWNQLFN